MQSVTVHVDTNQGISDEVLIFVYAICAVIGVWCANRFRIRFLQALEAREIDEGIRRDLDALRIPLEDQPPHGFNLPGRLAVYQKQRGSAFNAPISSIGGNAAVRVPAVSANSDGASILSPLNGAFAKNSAISSTYSGDAPTCGAFIVGRPAAPLLDDACSVSSADSFALSSLHSSEMNYASDAYGSQNKSLESAAERGCAVQIGSTQFKRNLIELDQGGDDAREGIDECGENSESSDSSESSSST
uniref:Uncharacterized protein n=1 Tax=Spumella elongata TaxID=89044 RepID=A0A7S3MHX1_9STRA|mmetsp:Transcript_9632/g.16797  ORF Transcript_9632/g.16797 Transcript_9632/m.16797 type:complete len:246 (+) Transcript_9632:689-1426(+)|eukprot:CAMPEP_0184967148 /NCGR_PEP_ID=MMETSP1098-20130426/627_1 /TAXON_ID=89044 /ORGANISM="Spumella elongata, Strain CCAP 955/1" /LENGTH=245 /DNA_ID=CAMNT_0027488561 /DNA_START=684 /DNA_END=1421 /DNA_ORIENTATION=+